MILTDWWLSTNNKFFKGDTLKGEERDFAVTNQMISCEFWKKNVMN